MGSHPHIPAVDDAGTYGTVGFFQRGTICLLKYARMRIIFHFLRKGRRNFIARTTAALTACSNGGDGYVYIGTVSGRAFGVWRQKPPEVEYLGKPYSGHTGWPGWLLAKMGCFMAEGRKLPTFLFAYDREKPENSTISAGLRPGDQRIMCDRTSHHDHTGEEQFTRPENGQFGAVRLSLECQVEI